MNSNNFMQPDPRKKGNGDGDRTSGMGYKGEYRKGGRLNTRQDFVSFHVGETILFYQAADTVTLPYRLDPKTHPLPASDPNLVQRPLGGIIDLTDVDATNALVTALMSTTPRSLGERFADIMTVEDFGAVGDGIADDTAALQAGIDWAGAVQGRIISSGNGRVYRITAGVLLRWDNKFLDESSACTIDFSNTTIVPDADNIVALKVSRNYANVYCGTVQNRNARTNVTAYALAPEVETQTTTRVSQMYCKVFNPVSRDCYTHFRFKAGPTVAAQNSGAYYHEVYSSRAFHADIGFHFARSESGDNLNTRISLYNPRHQHGHCSFDIEAADSLDVYSGTSEFINEAGIHAGNPTIKVHKPVPADALSSSLCKFHNFFGEVGTTPFEFEATESCSMSNSVFFAYTNDGITDSYVLNNMFSNEGAIVSRALWSPDSAPFLAVRRDVGPNQGQAYLTYKNSATFPAEFFADRGFTFASPINVARIADLQNTDNNSQILGSSLARAQVSGNASGTFKMFNTSGLAGRGFEFGGVFHIGPDNDNTISAATASKRYSVVYAATGTINTSDGREKTPPEVITDEILDAWGDVNHIAYKWLAAIKDKGEASARWHYGLIAQQVDEAFAARGINALEMGLLCYDEWDEDKEEGIEAGNRWGIRPDECMFLEAAYLRRELKRLKEVVDTLVAAK